jgi:hypothetical protein
VICPIPNPNNILQQCHNLSMPSVFILTKRDFS